MMGVNNQKKNHSTDIITYIVFINCILCPFLVMLSLSLYICIIYSGLFRRGDGGNLQRLIVRKMHFYIYMLNLRECCGALQSD